MVSSPKISLHARTRFAPSPTGPLHLGHVANAVWVWGVAARAGAEVIVRMEDHDRGRSRPEHEAAILADLRWLGLPVDGANMASFAGVSPFRQSDSPDRYRTAARRLDELGLVFHCECSRRDIAAAGTADAGEEAPYPGTCRDKGLGPDPRYGLRVRMPDREVTFDDLRHGPLTQRPGAQAGDVLIRDRTGNWTYQFCVVVDDLTQGVDLVVRGDDLLASTGRQILLGELLGRPAPPAWLHHPLIFAAGGTKLSKRDGASGLADLRAAGRTPAEILGLAACATGLLPEPRPVEPSQVGALFHAAQA